MGSSEDAIANAIAAEVRRAEKASQNVISAQQLQLLDASLEDAVLDLRGISWGFRSMFGTDDYEFMRVNPSVVEFQDALIYEACTFKEGLLLIAVNTIKYIKTFFKHYVEYKGENWIEKMKEVAAASEENGRLCAVLATWFLRLAGALEQRVPLAESLKKERLIFESKILKKNLSILKMKWTVTDHLLCPLMFVTDVGGHAAEFAVAGKGKEASDYSQAIQARKPGEQAAAAALVLTDSLIPVTKRFAKHLLSVSEVLLALGPSLRQNEPEPLPAPPKDWEDDVDSVRARLKAGEYGEKGKAAKAARLKAYQEALDNIPPEQKFQRAMLQFHHVNVERQKAHRAFNWCDDLVALDPLFDYDMEQVPAWKLKDRVYVDKWIDKQKTDDGEGLADIVRDVTKNAEILLALPK